MASVGSQPPVTTDWRYRWDHNPRVTTLFTEFVENHPEHNTTQ